MEHTKLKKVASWHDDEILQNELEYIREQVKEQGEEHWAYGLDDDKIMENISTGSIFEIEADTLTETINELFKERGEYWHVKGYNMGWLNRNGEKYAKITDWNSLLEEVFPRTSDFSFDMYSYYKGFKLVVYHHDSPMGEHYILKPISADKYEKEIN